MSDLTYLEKRQLEQLLGMGSGYVLNFSNRTFEEFVFDTVAKNIFEPKYENASGSKANRLRAFWKVEANYLVGKLVMGLVEYSREGTTDEQLWESCRRTAQRLLQGAPVTEIASIVPNSPEKEFEALANTLKAAIDNNEPESALDRLHTFVLKYLRVICARRGITVDREKPLHSLMGEYVKALKQSKAIESEMTERILKTSISLLDAFSHVRNEQSFAHDNKVLNYEESLLIFNQITSVVRFVCALEGGAPSERKPQAPDRNEIPF